jgi:drug/metabolite transporter (DMT)-like permease
MNLFLYALVVLIWGTTWIALKWQLGVVPIPLSITYRFALAAIVLFVLLAWKKQLRRPPAESLGLIAAQGVCLFCVNFVCFLNASLTIPSGLVAVVFSTSTLWNALLARVILHREIAPQVIGGGALGLAGLLLLFWPEITGHAQDAATLQGLAWALGGTLCFSSGNLLSSALQARGLMPAQTNAWGMALGAVLLLVYSLASGAPFVFDPSPRYVGALLYLAIPGSVIGFTAYLTLVGRLGPERAAYCTVLFPIVALNVSAVFEGYHWSAPAVAGLAFVMLGNVLVFKRGTGWISKQLRLRSQCSH